MTEEDALIHAVLAAPDDPGPQSVYADWLEERGDPRGEYLRCRCARAGLHRDDSKHAALLLREEELRQRHPEVILPWQRRLNLGRIKNLLGGTGRDLKDASTETKGRPSYTPEPCLTKRELAAWEKATGTTLPEEYRVFLLEIGNGGTMPGSYCDLEVWPLGTGEENPALLEPFPVTKERFRERLAHRPPLRGRELFPELDTSREDDPLPPPGCLAVARYPSYDGVWLVVTGELRGSLWCAAGWWPEFNVRGEQLDFLTWFVDTLVECQEPWR
jgi:uncharacterized protein (TIGR02996 family)